MNLQGNTVLITGGGGGLGLSLAKYFLREKNTVLICDLTKEKVEQAKVELPGIHGYVCDLTRREDRQKLFENVTAEFSGINILINNAAVDFETDFSKPVPEGVIETEITANFTAPAELMRLFLPGFLGKPRAAILNICSECGIRPFYPIPVYTGTKAGLSFFTEALRNRLHKQLGKIPVLIAEVYPPTMDTPLNAQWNVKKVPPDVVAEKILKGIRGDRPVIWAGSGEVYVYYWLSHGLVKILRLPRKVLRSIKRILAGDKVNW